MRIGQLLKFMYSDDVQKSSVSRKLQVTSIDTCKNKGPNIRY